MGDHILNHLGDLLEMKNRTIRQEAVRVFATYSFIDTPRVLKVIAAHLDSTSWDARVSASEALAAVLHTSVSGVSAPYRNRRDRSETKCDRLRQLNISELIEIYKPLLSAGSDEFKSSKKVSSRQQRSLIDQHLDFSIQAIGLTSANFLSDTEIISPSASNSPIANDFDNGAELNAEAPVTADDSTVSDATTSSASIETDIEKAVVEIVLGSLAKIVDARWQIRHGAALSISKVLAVTADWLTSRLIEEIALRLLQVLSLDRFNDFVSGRSATAPVREAVAQAIAHLINDVKHTDCAPNGGDLGVLGELLEHIKTLLSMKGEKLWVCRQSALLVMKYYFAIGDHSALFDTFFEGVVARLNDDVDDVVSSAVTALSSLFSNASIGADRKRDFISRVMSQMWTLLHTETKKDNMKAGLDGLIVDLLTMVHTWLREDESVSLTAEQLITIRSTMDAQFRTRTHVAVRIIALAVERKEFPIDDEELFILLRTFYRVLLFAPPTDTQAMLEEVYLTSLRLIDTRRIRVSASVRLRESIGLWVGCLLADHKTANIDVYAHGVDGVSSKRDDPLERFCSEEMRFMVDREKDGVFVTRKILVAKFVAALMQVLYETGAEIAGQKISMALQLLFVPILRSSSLFQNLGAAILLNEWAALWKAATARNAAVEVPATVIGLIDGYIRGPQRQFDEMAACCASLSSDCNEFVEWCFVRGAVSEEIDYTNSVEDISRQAYDSCMRACMAEEDEQQIESLNSRYALLCEQFEYTKMSVKANTARVYAFLSSSLFYFGFVGDKLTPVIRPLVDVMNGERNETVAVEVFRGAVPLLIAYSQQRQPKPYVKVLSRAMEAFASCTIRIPRPSSSPSVTSSSSRILSAPEASTSSSSTTLTSSSSPRDEKGDGKASPVDTTSSTMMASGDVTKKTMTNEGKDNEQSISSRNALLLLAVCTGFPCEQLPEFYAHFDLNEDELDDEKLLTRLELHRSLFSRVGSQLSDKSTGRILTLLQSSSPELRHAGAKAVETFAASRLADTFNRLYDPIAKMSTNLEEPNERRGAIEAIYRLSNLGATLISLAPLLAPIAFARLADQLTEIREIAGLAFRSLLPLLAVKRDTSVRPPEVSDALWTRCESNRAFVDLLSDPSRLQTVSEEAIEGLSNETKLRHYQLEGITWMGYLRRFGLCGILADDMGLGKTVQTLCTIVITNLEAETSRPSLVVCPRTLVQHWHAEWQRYFPGRSKQVVRAENATRSSMESAMVVVAAYDELKNNTVFPKIVWRYIVLDEGHILRNPRTLLFRSVAALRSESRLILSGTPVQNSSADLWPLFTFLIPGFLGDEKYFRQTFIKPIQQCRSPKASEAQMKDGQEALGRLHRLVLPFVLRRLKTDVLRELPEKLVSDYECTLTDLQRTIYEIIVDRCCSSPTGQRALSPLHALISLRKVVDHPSLVLDLADELQLSPELRSQLHNQDIAASGKLQALGQLLAECGILKRDDDDDTKEKEDDDSVSALLSSASTHPHRALIFCQWRASVDLVVDALSNGFSDGKNRASPISHLILNGSVPPNERQGVVDRFNHDKSIDVLVLTTHIGGVGLNLTGADVVIFLDHDWNPMKDLQAIDRAHRLGQTRNVNVYRLITKGTIEEKVMSYQRFKKNTADALIGAENRSLSSMKTDELLSMFSLDDSSSTTSSGGGSSSSSKGPKAKKMKVDMAAGGDDVWNLSEIWDESQYDEAYSVSAFLKDVRK